VKAISPGLEPGGTAQVMATLDYTDPGIIQPATYLKEHQSGGTDLR